MKTEQKTKGEPRTQPLDWDWVLGFAASIIASKIKAISEKSMIRDRYLAPYKKKMENEPAKVREMLKAIASEAASYDYDNKI